MASWHSIYQALCPIEAARSSLFSSILLGEVTIVVTVVSVGWSLDIGLLIVLSLLVILFFTTLLIYHALHLQLFRKYLAFVESKMQVDRNDRWFGGWRRKYVHTDCTGVFHSQRITSWPTLGVGFLAIVAAIAYFFIFAASSETPNELIQQIGERVRSALALPIGCDSLPRVGWIKDREVVLLFLLLLYSFYSSTVTDFAI